jgi:hypothetical protein
MVDRFRSGDLAALASNSFTLGTSVSTLQSMALDPGDYLVIATAHVLENDDLVNLMLVVDGVAQVDQAEVDANKTAVTLCGPLSLTASDTVLLRGVRTGSAGTVQARLMVCRLDTLHVVS